LKIKHLLIILIMFAGLGKDLRAQVRFTYGLEWAYSGVFMDFHKFNYFSTDGVRVEDSLSEPVFKSTGQLYANAGVNLGSHWAVAFYSGFTAIYENRKVIPYSLRLTYFTKAYDSSGWKVFLDGGSAYALAGSFNHKPLIIAKAGTGYRFPIYKEFCLDVFTSLQFTSDYPLNIYDKYTYQPVPHEVLRFSSRYGMSLAVGCALSF